MKQKDKWIICVQILVFQISCDSYKKRFHLKTASKHPQPCPRGPRPVPRIQRGKTARSLKVFAKYSFCGIDKHGTFSYFLYLFFMQFMLNASTFCITILCSYFSLFFYLLIDRKPWWNCMSTYRWWDPWECCLTVELCAYRWWLGCLQSSRSTSWEI